MPPAETLGVLAALLQVLGYILYARNTLQDEIIPNPTTWLMFAYGTALLTLLEWERQAPFNLLLLPVTCAAMSVLVAMICWRRGKLRWPESRIDRCALLTDLALTAGYAALWIGSAQVSLGSATRGDLILLFLLLTNASGAVAFIPIVRETYQSPHRERTMPWLVWCMAYTLLAYATFSEAGVRSVLLVYPISNALLHGAVGWLAMRAQVRSTLRQL